MNPAEQQAAVSIGMRRIADALRRNRHKAALCLVDSIAKWEKFAPSLASMGLEAFMAWETIPLLDYLINYLHENKPVWRNLFIGERIKQLDWPADTLLQIIERRDGVFTADRDALLNLLASEVAEDELKLLAATLDEARELVTTRARTSREFPILLVGDCLFLDLCTFLTVPLLENGITLRPIYATSKNPIELRSALRGLKGKKFELVCYSPYSYEFSVILTQTHYFGGIRSTPQSLRKLAGDAHRQIAPTLRLLCDEFDTNVVVHNTANVRRHNSSLASYAKNIATRPARKIAAKEANTLLAETVAEHNVLAGKPIILLDELDLVARYGELALGRKFYHSEPQHPTAMALRLSDVYLEIIGAARSLLGRKVIVLDLDNTLWAGVIGEGSVVHDRRRQQVLKLLRQKGVLLAIASKNDPNNVHWTGAVLEENDFVATQINWDPKSASIKRIAEELNLKLKDFVFIDDRPDEREMVSLSIPAIYCMDATADSTWRMLDWWEKALPEQNDSDRTQLYLERRKRQSHLDEAAEEGNQQELFGSLGLTLEIREASSKELQRAAELINRTNQFNTCGSRVSAQQVEAWQGSSQHHILVAEAADKFGAMGIISVMVLEQVGEALLVPVWVLSCRVFGFGIESAMLNRVCLIAQRLGVAVIRGQIVETPNNQPCRNVYSANGFAFTGTYWELRATELPPIPAWLSVTAQESQSALAN